MRHLYKEGLRRCCYCKEIKSLDSENFYSSKVGRGYKYECIPCVKVLALSRPKAKPRAYRFKVFQRDNFTCTYCGRKPPEVILEVDHILAKSRGGVDKMENYTTACRECNQGKHTKLI